MGLLKEIVIKAGVIKDDTELAAHGRWTNSDRIRFVRGLPQKLGGWVKQVSSTFDGKCRGLLAWQDAASVARLGVGTHKKLYALEGDTFFDITPLRESGSLTDPFTTTSGSAIVNVQDAGHAEVVGDFVNFSGASAVGGITIDGAYQVKTVVDSGNYTIEHSAAATSSASGGSTVSYEYEIHVGLEDGTRGTGYGVGTYGSGTYGTARSTYILLPPRIWSLDQWGQYLLGCPRDGNIYEWQLNTAVRAQLLANAPTDNIGILVTEEKHLLALGAGGNKLLLQWPDQDDNTNWTVSDQTTAGSRNLVGGSEILFGVRTRGTNLIFTNASVFTVTFIGGSGTFGIRTVAAGASGIIAPRAACEVNGVVFWMGLNDFYMYDGSVRPIPNSKDNRRFVFDNLVTDQIGKVFCAPNTLFSEIWWFYATTTEIDRYIKVNLEDFSWDVGSLVRTAMIDRDEFANPLMAGGDGYVYAHESGVDADGAAMNETIKSAPRQLGDGHYTMEIFNVIPDFEDLVGTVTLTLLTRYYPHDTEFQRAVGTVSPTTTKLDIRASGRQTALQLDGSGVGDFWRLGTVRMEVERAGER